jgi:penicillin V acylase-like amidase (Ntn superfamily)
MDRIRCGNLCDHSYNSNGPGSLLEEITMIKSVLCLFLFTAPVLACSAFLLSGNDRHIAAKNYDWNLEDGRIIVNAQGLCKSSFGTKLPLTWCSKYGNVTFNQYGMEFPCGGINEKGLVVEALWLAETNYPVNDDGKPEIDNMQWIQYQLDNSADIQDVITNDKDLAIHPIAPTAIHYFVADKSGKSLIFESVNGAMHHYLPDANNPAMLTNTPYDKSVGSLKKCKVFGGTLETPEGQGSLSRFIQMAVLVKKGVKKDPVDQSFTILSTVRMSGFTKWSIVYDLDSSIIYFRTASRHAIRKIDMNRIDFSCSPVRSGVDIKLAKSGDITGSFEKYDIAANEKLISVTFNKTDFIKSQEHYLVQALEKYLGSITCGNSSDQSNP